MKILGIGVDIVENIRIHKSLKNVNFIKRVFSSSEILLAKNIVNKKSYYSKRFAAKEAFSKALGTGLRGSVNLQAISITHNNMGKPSFEFNKQVQNILSNRNIIYQHLSISDEKNIAVAFVVLDKL